MCAYYLYLKINTYSFGNGGKDSGPLNNMMNLLSSYFFPGVFFFNGILNCGIKDFFSVKCVSDIDW